MSRSCPTLKLTSRAAKHIANLLSADADADADSDAESDSKYRLRISVTGGGCAGFQYGFSLDDKLEGNDLVLKNENAIIVIDNLSADLLFGAEVDWIESLEGNHFSIGIPHATASCSCGSSFSI